MVFKIGNYQVNNGCAGFLEDDLRNSGIDIIRAVSIALILIWNLQPVTKAMMHIDSLVGALGWLPIGFFYRYISLLAVPTFICISIMLFIKRSLFTHDYWKKRLIRLIEVFLFWTCIQFIFYLLAGGGFPLPLDSIIPTGGPELPYVGGSVFYFLFALTICTGLAVLFLKLPDGLKFIVSTIIIILSCLIFIISSHYGIPLKVTEMENYYLYVPIAYYMVKHQDKLVRYRILFIFGYILAIVYETGIARGTISMYARISVVFGVLSFISILLPLQLERQPLMEFLSKYFLGIFSLHKYWQYVFIVFLGIIKPQVDIPICSGNLILFMTTIVLTFISVHLLGKTKLRRYVS